MNAKSFRPIEVGKLKVPFIEYEKVLYASMQCCSQISLLSAAGASVTAIAFTK